MNNESVTLNRRHAGAVKRYHTWPTLTQQTVAEHCWNVALIYTELFDLPPAEVFWTMLHHDSAEVGTGDLPFRNSNEQPWLLLKESKKFVDQGQMARMGIEEYRGTDKERQQIKIADLLEMYEYGMHESRLGNQYGLIICQNVEPTALKIAADLGITEKIQGWITRNSK